MPRKKVAILLHTPQFGGAERALVNLARAFDAKGVAVDFLASECSGPYLDDLPPSVNLTQIEKRSRRVAALQLGLRVPGLLRAFPELFLRKARYMPPELKMIPSVSKYLCDQRPDALLTTISRINLCAIWARQAARTPTRIVIREANTFSIATRESRHAFDSRLPELARQWYPQADSIISVCDSVGEDLARTICLARERIATIYNPVDLERILRLSNGPNPHSWLEDPSVPVVLAVGRLHPQKDHDTLLRALARLNERRRVRLIILGEGPRRGHIEALSRELGIGDKVELPGNQANPFAFMSRASLIVLSSAWEGFPNVLLEALACGLPVISTDCPSGGPRELLRDGEYGTLVPVGESEALAEAMEAHLKRPQQTSSKGLAYVSQFTMDRSAEGYLGQLLGRDTPRPLKPSEDRVLSRGA